MSKKSFLMCPPDYFDINYKINPWMNKRIKVDPRKARQQWNALKNKLEELGAKIELVQPQKGWPDMVFIDAGVIYSNTFISSNFYYKKRQGEREYFIKWFNEHGYFTKTIDKAFYFEGHGDTLWASKSKLFCGYGFKSCVEAHHEVEKIIRSLDGTNIDFVPVELVDERFYHLDTCFCPLGYGDAIFYPKAFSKQAQRMLEKNIYLIPIDEDEALKFAGNAVVVDRNIVIPAGTDKICKILERYGYQTHQLNLSEFIKSGGAGKCLSMPLD